MLRRTFLNALPAAALAQSARKSPRSGPIPMGLNTYCLRALNWPDPRHLDYCAEQKLDAIFLQDSLDPKRDDPAHWAWVKNRAQELNLHLETGGPRLLPPTPSELPQFEKTLRHNIRRAAAMGSPLVRTLLAGDRFTMPPGPVEQHVETAAKLLKTVKSQAVDSNVKLAVEVHKDMQAWQHKELIELAGKDFVGTYLDTGNPVFVMEDPMVTVETLGPYALTFHLRDSVLYEHPGGVAIQWVPLGEGVVDFKAIIAKMREVCPDVYVYVKPITGRPPQVLPVFDHKYWETYYPRARASEFARFMALVKKGRPYEKHVVIEDIQNRKIPDHFLQAIQFQQKDHMERSLAYARQTLGLGVRRS